MAKLVTLTTDWGRGDYYIGAFKAAVLKNVEDVTFIDITHQIKPFSLTQAAFIIKSVIPDFPEGTIHIITVDSEPEANQPIIIAKYCSQYFICTDNGMLGYAFDEKPEYVVKIDCGLDYEGSSFIEKTLFPVLIRFIFEKGDAIKEMGELAEDVRRYTNIVPIVNEKCLIGKVMYVDSYGNAITNIDKDTFQRVAANKEYTIYINSKKYFTNRVYNSYKTVERGEIVTLFNSLNLLEVAIRDGDAANLLRLDDNSEIKVDFSL